MDRPHSIEATADTIINLGRGDTLAIRALSSAAVRGAVPELSALLTQLADSLLATSRDSAGQIFDRIIARAFVPERDAALLAAVLRASDSGIATRSSIATSAAGEGRTEIVFVNGILTTPADIKLILPDVQTVAYRNGLTSAAGYDVTTFENKSALPESVADQTLWMCLKLKMSAIVSGEFTALNSIAPCFPRAVGIADLPEAVKQAINLVFRQDPSGVQEDAKRLAEMLHDARLRGQRVILLAHSQGNLMVGEALRFLNSDARWTRRDNSCVTWVAVAPPIVPIAAPSMPTPSALIVKGAPSADILYQLYPFFALSDVVKLPNELSTEFDGLSWAWLRLLPLGEAIIGVQLHGIRNSYFWSPATSSEIGASLLTQVGNLERTCATLPPTPTDLTPGSLESPGPTQSDISVTLRWTGTPGATFNVRVLDVSASALLTVSSVTGNSHTLTLAAGRQYRWDVSACNSAGCSPASPSVYFQTPGPVVPPSPTNPTPGSLTSPGPVLATKVVTLGWTGSLGATSYTVAVLDLTTNSAATTNGVTGTSYTVTLDGGRAYRWTVTACNTAGCNSVSTLPLYFQTPTTVGVPAAPTNFSPGSATSPGPELSNDTVTMTWSASPGATAYNLRILDIGTNALITASGLTVTTFTLALTTARQYRWEVIACNTAGCSAPSGPLYFQTPNGVDIPAVPENPSPGSLTSPGPLLSSSTVTFTWAPSRGATVYNMRVLDVGSNNFIDVLNTVTPSFTLTLNSGRTYSWYVTACNSVGCNPAHTTPVYFRTP